jgi:DNA-binding beta-propeller fold protein YncE
MTCARAIRFVGTVMAALGLIGLYQSTDGQHISAQGRGRAQAPRFEVDPLWPQPLPNSWILGPVNGVTVDARDHIWIVQVGSAAIQGNERGPDNNPPTSTCCSAAPQVLEFDAEGNLLSKWGGRGQGFDWPLVPQGIAVDAAGNVIIGGAQAGHIDGRPDPAPPAGRGGRGNAAAPPPNDAHVIKFTRTGQLVWQIGKPAQVEGSESKTTLNRPAGFDVDNAANEIYIADGLGNRRVLVVDAATGAYKRHWGAYGEKPDDAVLPPYDPNAPPARQFRGVSCVRLARDGMVYVCDRQNDRVQVFQKDGTFVKEGFVSKTTIGDGSVWDIAFSRDPQQQFMYVADGHDKTVFVLRRDTLEVVANFGQGGRLPGTFYGVGSIAVDSKGNVYTGETFEGHRVQKFVYKGMGPASVQR